MSSTGLFVGPLLSLRTVPAFGGLSQTHLATLAQDVEEVVVQRGSPLVGTGTPATAFYVVVDGEVEVAGRAGGRTVGPGSTVGFLEILAGRAAETSARARTDVVALRLDEDALRGACERHFGVTHALLEFVAAGVSGDAAAYALAARGDPLGRELPRDEPLDRVARVLALHRAPAFPSNVMDALSELAEHLAPVRAAAGARLWAHGDAADAFLVVCSGALLVRAGSGADAVRVGPGGLAGLADALAGGHHARDAVAHGDVVALQVDFETFLDVLEDHFAMASGVLAFLSGCLLDGPATPRT